MFRTALLVGLGFATHAVAQERPYLIDLNSKTMTALGSLGDMNTYPTALNDAQQVVGYFGKRGGDYHPFITDSDGVGVREIRGPVPFHWWSGAPGINNAGQVVGTHSPGVAYSQVPTVWA